MQRHSPSHPCQCVHSTCFSSTDYESELESSSESGPSHHSVMVVRFACMACQGGPQGPTLQPTRLLQFIMSAPLPATSPCVASPLLYCPTGQLTQKQGALGQRGGGLGRPNSPAAQLLHNGASASKHDTCQHTYSIRFTDIYPMSRILYDFVVTVYDIVEKSAVPHTISEGGGVPRRVLKLLHPSFL